ncbi:MAG TPA: serine hydrolase [Candidatus Paceibacterota bacterium]|nr:serine hydrolase [Candidatus Paceibacterota bacterium]
MTLPHSKAINYTLAGASAVCAIVLTFVYSTDTPLSGPSSQAAPPPIVMLSPDSLTAKAVVIYDPGMKKMLFAKNADESLPLASLTKLMTAEAVLSTVQDTGEEITITPEDLTPDGDWGFKPGEAWPLSDLLRFGLVASSNDAMQAVSTAVPGDAITVMNMQASRLGLTKTYFNNPTGLDVDLETAGAYGSARDMAVLGATFLSQYPALFEATVAPSVTITEGARSLSADSTSVPLHYLPGLIAAKTGYTDLAGGNLVAAFDLNIGRPIVIAVLGSTEDGRFKDVEALLAAAQKALTH